MHQMLDASALLNFTCYALEQELISTGETRSKQDQRSGHRVDSFQTRADLEHTHTSKTECVFCIMLFAKFPPWGARKQL
jgi:hypothetical protein